MADLERFVAAQDTVLSAVHRELAAGHKESHWMWFVFPQIAGLGASPTARFYALESLGEARDYLAHPVLGARLAEATRLVLGHAGRTAASIFGSPDDMKFRSSMTLFAAASPNGSIFSDSIDVFYAGSPDPLTLQRLEANRLDGDGS